MKLKKHHHYIPLFRGGNDTDPELFDREAEELFHADTTIQELYLEHGPDAFHEILKRHQEKHPD
jgi:hypothetical protein